MTLGELKDSGQMPTPYQVFMLELDFTKECRQHGPSPHRYHCTMMSDGSINRSICPRLHDLWWGLENMFPGIEIDKQ